MPVGDHRAHDAIFKLHDQTRKGFALHVRIPMARGGGYFLRRAACQRADAVDEVDAENADLQPLFSGSPPAHSGPIFEFIVRDIARLAESARIDCAPQGDDIFHKSQLVVHGQRDARLFRGFDKRHRVAQGLAKWLFDEQVDALVNRRKDHVLAHRRRGQKADNIDLARRDHIGGICKAVGNVVFVAIPIQRVFVDIATGDHLA